MIAENGRQVRTELSYCQHQFAKIWAFEKVYIWTSLINNRAKVKLKFFKSPYFGKPFCVSGNGCYSL
jgi:hypothetical protein